MIERGYLRKSLAQIELIDMFYRFCGVLLADQWALKRRDE